MTTDGPGRAPLGATAELTAVEPHAAAQPRRSPCTYCGSPDPGPRIRFDRHLVCGRCKPFFLARLRQGVAMPGQSAYGGFWPRLGAKMVDGLALSLPNGVIVLVGGFLLASQDVNDAWLGTAVAAAMSLLQLVLGLCYSVFMVGHYGATLGKLAFHLRIVTPEGGRVSYGRALGRYLAEILSTLTLMLGYAMAAFDLEKRTLHDRVAGTRVIEV